MPNILFLDLEIAPMIVSVYSLKNTYISPENIIHDSFIICGCWKWANSRKVYSGTYKNKDKMLSDLHSAVTEADIIVGHNVKNFDLKWLNTEMINCKGMPLPKTHVVDTLTAFRNLTRYPSKSMRYLAHKLELNNVKSSIDMGETRYLHFKDNNKLLKKLVAYCKQDVRTTESLYYAVRPYITNHPNLATMSNSDKKTCPTCMSTNLYNKGLRRTSTMTYRRFQCLDCGAWSRERISSTPYVKPELVNC